MNVGLFTLVLWALAIVGCPIDECVWRAVLTRLGTQASSFDTEFWLNVSPRMTHAKAIEAVGSNRLVA